MRRQSRPIDPEVMGMHPDLEPAPSEAARVRKLSMEAFAAAIKAPLPDTFQFHGLATGWYSDQGELRQLRAEAKLPREAFQSRENPQNWTEIAIPKEFLASMHLSPAAPKSYMTCYLGQIEGKPAYLFWSDDAETMMLVVDY